MLTYTNIMPPHTFSQEKRHQTFHIKKLGSTQWPYHHHHHGHFFSHPSCSRPKSLRPLTKNTYASGTVVVGVPNWVTAPNSAHWCSKWTIGDPPKSPPHRPCSDCLPCSRRENRATGRCQQVRRTNLICQNCRRRPIRGCRHRCLQPHCRRQCVMYIN